MFWHVDDHKAFNVDEIVSRAKDFVDNMAKRTTSEADRTLMEQALKHVYVMMLRCCAKSALKLNTVRWSQMI